MEFAGWRVFVKSVVESATTDFFCANGLFLLFVEVSLGGLTFLFDLPVNGNSVWVWK